MPPAPLPILEGIFPEDNDAIASLPEEPTPIILPAFGPYVNPNEGMETEETEADTTAYTSLPAEVPGAQPTEAHAAAPSRLVVSTCPAVQAEAPTSEVAPQTVSLLPHAPTHT